MAEHGALATLKDLAEKEVEDAARLLGEMRRGCQRRIRHRLPRLGYRNRAVRVIGYATRLPG